MSWIDKLKALFNVEINSPIIYFNFVKNSNNKNKSENKDYSYDPTKKEINLFLDRLPTEKRKELKSVLKDYLDEGKKLLEIETHQLLHGLYQYNQNNEDGQILTFFKDIIPPNDFEALQSSLYLRYVFYCRRDVRQLKIDIRQRFGDRGNNISNLCTAGYFEKFLIPLYNSAKEQFNSLYEQIVSKSIVAVFVHQSMKPEEITSEINSKVEISKRYGIKFIHIHGIGVNNVKKIKELIQEKKTFFDFFDKNVYEKDNILILELILK